MVFALLSGACHRSAGEPPRGEVTQGGARSQSREELVEQADRMASAAARESKGKAGELLEQAVSLRLSLFRSQHRTVDALEAIENLKTLERLAEAPCSARLRRVLLEGEVKGEPGQTYRELYALRARTSEPECRQRAQRALSALSAYRPLPSVLAELERGDAGGPEPRPSASVAAAPSGSASTPGPLRVTRIERYGADDAARVVVFVTRPSRFEVGNVAGEHPRVFVDIDGASFAGSSSYDVGGLVERVRLGAQAHGVRVVVDLKQAATHRVFYLPEPFRLVIDVMKEGLAPAGSDRGKLRVRRVVLDPGHGGHDPGAIGPSGLREKDVALDIAHRAAPLIARELGISTLLTRDGDQFVPLDERTARANAFHADLFVSIHCNASEDGAAKGIMTFVLDAGREELSERIAARENAASSEAAVELANSFSRITDPSSLAASARFAELLQRSAMASLSQRYPEVLNGGVKRAGFYVLAGARMPAALFETSFISNPQGEARLNSGDFRQRMADAIVNAVRAYREGL
ncbi:MAG: N-acetylmuramoyl-L-alanine amidase [Polyangiaceae bacterium]